jgi:hypothetical protein
MPFLVGKPPKLLEIALSRLCKTLLKGITEYKAVLVRPGVRLQGLMKPRDEPFRGKEDKIKET